VTVARILRQKGSAVIAVGLNDSLQTIVDTLARNRVGVVVVIDSAHGLAGIISERDVVRAMAGDASSVLAKSAADIMITEVETCTPDDPEGEIMQRMSVKGVRHLPVLVEGRLAGIVSMRDVIRLRLEKIDELMRSIEREAEQMKTYLSKVG